ncbi:MAG: lipase family protein [Eubacteriales bacterium]
MNKRELMQMLELSSIAYRDNQPLCRHTRLTFVEDAATDTECYVRTREGETIIAFRGTDSHLNWHNNFLFAKRVIPYGNPDSGIRVHEGFLKTYKSVRKQIHALIPSGSCRVTVTGHSLGAALAVLCAVDVQYNFPQKDVQAYVFGCPRVGNAAFARSYNKRVFKTLRVSNGNDIVTKVPPALLGYRHVGINIHTGALRLPFAFSFTAHEPRNYYRCLWQ